MSIGEFREERFTGSDLLNVLNLKFDLGRTYPLTGIWIILQRDLLPARACVLVSSMTLSPRLMKKNCLREWIIGQSQDLISFCSLTLQMS